MNEGYEGEISENDEGLQRELEFLDEARKFGDLFKQKKLGDPPKQTPKEPDQKYEDLVRKFSTGATRDKDEHKNDYEGFFSPLVFRRYGDYMQKHRLQKDGSVRASDNWQKGMGLDVFIKSKWRHFMDIWTIHRRHKAVDFDGVEVDIEDALCADLFNTMGYLHEVLKTKEQKHKCGGNCTCGTP